MPARRLETATPEMTGLMQFSLRQAKAKLGGVTGVEQKLPAR